jgi:hypothetical protein
LARRTANNRVKFVRQIELAQIRFKPLWRESSQIAKKGDCSKMAEIGLEGFNGDWVMVDSDGCLAASPLKA